MSKTDSDFVNTQQEHELNDWLGRNGYKRTEENRKKLVDHIGDAKTHFGKKSADNLTWEELDTYHADVIKKK